MAKINVGVIGVGGWGKNHLRVYSELKEYCNVKAICDSNEQRAKQFGRMYKVNWYTDFKNFLKEDLDGVSICTPTSTHYSTAMKVIKAGINLLVEKPLAYKVSDALKIFRAVKTKRIKLTVGFIERFNSGVMKLRELIKKNELGDLRYISSGRMSSWSPAITNTGVITDVAIHDIDVIRFILGKDPIEVYAKAQNRIKKHPPQYETNAEIFLTFPDGESAYLVAEWLKPVEKHKKIRQLQVTGSKGTAILSYIPQLVWKIDAVDIVSPFIDVNGRPKYRTDPKNVSLLEPIPWKEPLKLELKNFIETLANNEKPVVSGLDGVRALEVAETALKSARLKTPQTITYTSLK
ncbi:MAG: Gfo/Idh/MocA family oxidoreductase [Candidatus Bathyarchaeota archaeon]